LDNPLSKSYAAIDPGLGGGIALWMDGQITLHPMPEDQAELADIIPYGCTVAIEKVPPFVGRLIPSSAAFKLGKSAGWMEGWCVGRQHPVIMVTPQVWQAGLGIPKGDKTQSQWKSALKAEASRRFPAVSGLTLKTADALLILGWHIKHNSNITI
jgi:hypothetical protein